MFQMAYMDCGIPCAGRSAYFWVHYTTFGPMTSLQPVAQATGLVAPGPLSCMPCYSNIVAEAVD